MRQLAILATTTVRAISAETALAVGAAVLLASQQDVAGHRPLHPRIKLPAFAQERDGDVALAAQLHQRRAARNLSEADNAPQRMDWHAQLGFLVHTHQDGFAVTRQVCALRGDVERVEKVSHVSKNGE